MYSSCTKPKCAECLETVKEGKRKAKGDEDGGSWVCV